MKEVKPVLIVEDDPGDQELLEFAFGYARIECPLVMLSDGQAAIDYLRAPELHPAPGLLLTDLKLPRVDGFALLGWVQQQAHLRDLPILVLTASDQPCDQQRALRLGARACFVKPCSFEALVEMVGDIKRAWL